MAKRAKSTAFDPVALGLVQAADRDAERLRHEEEDIRQRVAWQGALRELNQQERLEALSRFVEAEQQLRLRRKVEASTEKAPETDRAAEPEMSYRESEIDRALVDMQQTEIDLALMEIQSVIALPSTVFSTRHKGGRVRVSWEFESKGIADEFVDAVERLVAGYCEGEQC